MQARAQDAAVAGAAERARLQAERDTISLLGGGRTEGWPQFAKIRHISANQLILIENQPFRMRGNGRGECEGRPAKQALPPTARAVAAPTLERHHLIENGRRRCEPEGLEPSLQILNVFERRKVMC